MTFASITLNAGQVYYLNFENEASNGKAFYLEYASDDTYADGTYYEDGSDEEKDAWFQVWGTPAGASTAGGTTLVGEDVKLSKNPDFSTEDRVFEPGEMMFILVWSDQLDPDSIKEARWQLEGSEQSLHNNLDGTYAAQVLIDEKVKQLSSGEIAVSKIQVQMEDESGHQLQIEVAVTLMGPPPTGSTP